MLINIISSINPTVHQVINQLRYRLSGPCPCHGSLGVPSIDLPTKRRHTICTPAVTVLEGLSNMEISSEMGIPKDYVRTFGQLSLPILDTLQKNKFFAG